MSAIIGVIGKKINQDHLQQMLEKIKHRGPRNPVFRILAKGGLAAGSIDLSPRATAVLAEQEDLYVLFDGELYNPLPEGKTNAQFLLERYQQDGIDCFSGMDGIFSCAIVDAGETILFRDPIGSRSLLYSDKGDCFCFASEAKALMELATEVEELPPGAIYSTKTGLSQCQPYTPGLPDFSSPAEAAEILENLMVEAVKKRMADGAVRGVSLSGGLDSSIIAAIAKSIDPGIELFSTTICRYPSKDLEFARLMADFLGLKHHIYEISDEDIHNFIPDAVWYMETFDEDCISGAIANFYTSRMIAQHMNCILVGEGADELFGGYFRELKEIPDEKQKEKIAAKLLAIAYNTALRRLDRGWIANSVSYRTPFLDRDVVAFSAKLPMNLKVRYDEAQARNVEKWILREAFRGWLPAEITDRPKLRFAGGTGVDDLMDELTAEKVTGEEFRQNPRTENGLELCSPKELHYYRLFRASFPRAFEKLVVRWDPFK